MFGSGKPAAMDTYVKERDLKHHRSTIVAAITKYPSKRAQALVTVLCREYDLKVKWKALQNYVRREGLWTSVPGSVATGSVAASSSMAASSSEPVSSIPVARIADLPLYRDAILSAIRDNPGKRAKALATLLDERYEVCKVGWDALKTYIDREKLYDIASSARVTPMRSVAASSSFGICATPTENVKIGDLPSYRDVIIRAIKANPG